MTRRGPSRPGFNIKETTIAIVISFTMAFVFRGFVIEGFLIPTGSMAPTLLGKHMLIRDADSGYEWTVGPWDYINGNPNLPAPRQGDPQRPIVVNDPMTGRTIERVAEPLRAGDRLFVLKYLEHVYEPSRWEVVVFKAPHVEPQNYIKRLLGLPGERVALVDGDVFFIGPDDDTDGSGIDGWASGAWNIARKPERVQREVWQTVFDSDYTPPEATQQDVTPSQRFRPPWAPGTPGWEGVRTERSYRYTGSGETSLKWDPRGWPAPGADADPIWHIDDYTAYNQLRSSPQAFNRDLIGSRSIFPVSDVSVRFGIEPEGDAKNGAIGLLTARGMQFRCVLDSAGARLERRMQPTTAGDLPEWITIDSAERPGGFIEPGRVTNVEFWHADQALSLYINGDLVCGGIDDGGYEMSPSERIASSTGRSLESLLTLRTDDRFNPLGDPRNFLPPSVEWSFSGGPFTLHRVGLDRDLHYQVGQRRTLGGHPDLIAELSPDHFMLCGDNSANSLDARFWDIEYPWITESIHGGETHLGLVHRDLIIGRAFVVYLPSPYRRGWIPMLDVGRMRWIW